MQDHLFNMEPVALEVPMCREPGCTKPRRRKQGARYCEEHARAIDYAANGLRPEYAFKVAGGVCQRCGAEYRRNRYAGRTPESLAWDEVCPDCRNATPLTLAQMQSHRVGYERAVQWLVQGEELPCALCGNRVDRRRGSRKPTIDHHHECCPGQSSCGQCIRGVLCTQCNTQVGNVEKLLQRVPVQALREYLGTAVL